MAKTVSQINEKIKKGTVVVVSAEAFTAMAKEKDLKELSEEVDIVTTATFGPMCSSGAIINFGHWSPGIRMEEITLNGVNAYEGLAAVDTYIGATSESKFDATYGGANVIEELIDGKDVRLHARGKGTDCYPTKEIDTYINKDTINEFYLFNPRNAYQNYAAATNSTNRIRYTYMGSLLPRFSNVTYSTSGELSPLLNDPYLRTIGLGTRIFLGGGEGYVVWNGTQFNTRRERTTEGIPTLPGATLAVIGDAKQMSREYIRSAYYEKYGISMFVGIGIPIPVLDEKMAAHLAISNEKITTNILDYGQDGHPSVGTCSYAQLASGSVTLSDGKEVKTAPLSSLAKAREIADVLASWIKEKRFYLSEPVHTFPTDSFVKPLVPREGGEK
ncbi:homocysteine biosynthesis protein [uncultured Sphaerochaeta sp.]|uniref:homocysteine biosynthesis protein n=1 Tax=uncultured Sphaerochaeta sp. TaxID=886478 RepID=UPI0029CA7A58|nr:homocysteine biosynthesis protein [uncultured Sphaerochaeta sp.]